MPPLPADPRPAALLLAGVRERGQRPFTTFTDEGTGERVELGWATFENWTAKTANLLVDELDLAPGDVLLVDVGTHWTAPIIQVAAWRAGLVVALPGVDGDVAAVARREDRPAADPAVPELRVGTGMAGRLTADAGEALPFAEEVLAFGDLFDDHDGGADEPALRDAAGSRTHAELVAEALEHATWADLEPGARYATTVPAGTAAGVVAGPVLTLALIGSHLLVVPGEATDLGELVTAERCGVLLLPAGVEAPHGVPSMPIP